MKLHKSTIIYSRENEDVHSEGIRTEYPDQTPTV